MNNKTHNPKYVPIYKAGAKAKKYGERESDNPYPVLSMGHTAWLAGFRECIL